LGFRGVSFEFRMQSMHHRREWDVAFGVGSLLAALMQGLVLGGLMQGISVHNRQFAGSVLDVIHLLPIISGVALVFGYGALGAGWLNVKSNKSLQHFANRSRRVCTTAFAVFFSTASIYAARIQPGIRAQWASHGTAFACLVGLFAVAVGTLISIPGNNRTVLPFLIGQLLFVVSILAIALVVFPDIVPFGVSLWDASSSSSSQRLVMISAACVTPVVLAYSAFAYWVFRGKTPEKGWDA
jgi:cytochrome bd ubiquinol oxidase subunit II